MNDNDSKLDKDALSVSVYGKPLRMCDGFIAHICLTEVNMYGYSWCISHQ